MPSPLLPRVHYAIRHTVRTRNHIYFPIEYSRFLKKRRYSIGVAAKRKKFNYLRYEYRSRSSSNLDNLIIDLCVYDDDIVT